MKLVKYENFPEWAVYYCFYGESDNLTKEEIKQIEDFLLNENLDELISISDDSYFTSCPVFGLASNCFDVTFTRY